MGFTIVANSQEVSAEVMKNIYEQVKTPYKYGPILMGEKGKLIDSPSIFRSGNMWYMTYVLFDGKGYETWLAKSNDMLEWTTLGRVMPFTTNTWDSNQKAGYVALQDYEWGGSYKLEKYKGKYWASYIGGCDEGYEAGKLGIGIANAKNLTKVTHWNRTKGPVLDPRDKDARWYDNNVIYKSSVIHDKSKTLGHPFVMFYNAKGMTKSKMERIAIATSDDMVTWKRYGSTPAVEHEDNKENGITGDAYITKIGDVWVMFYFGAFWKPGAFDRFACSYDLVNWTRWEGEDLVEPSESYDNMFAHKPCVIKYNNIVYHFYNAVDSIGNRSVALATSKPIGKSRMVINTK